jgi:hypothetical protein
MRVWVWFPPVPGFKRQEISCFENAAPRDGHLGPPRRFFLQEQQGRGKEGERNWREGTWGRWFPLFKTNHETRTKSPLQLDPATLAIEADGTPWKVSLR